MIRQLGIPTLFITLSAAEIKWPELIVILKGILENEEINEQVAEDMNWESKASLIRRDPITCSRYFDYKFRQCQEFLLLSKSGIFKEHPVLDFFTRIEFQHRGSPHMHGLFWLSGAPNFDEDDPNSFSDCCAFIDKYISCSLDVEDVLHQTHKHTSNCEVKFKGEKKCRYGMPYPPMRQTQILLPFPMSLESSVKEASKTHLKVIKMHTEDLCKRNIEIDYDSFLEYLGLTEHQYIMAVRSGIMRPTVFLQRNIKDAFYNAFNPGLAKAWRANMDIQFVLDAYACCKYCAAYVSKSCRGMSELLKKVIDETKKGNVSCKEKLKKIAHTFLSGSEVSAQEAAYTVLGMALSKASRDCVYINTSRPSERVIMTKSTDELKKLDPESTNITIDGLIDHYINRPAELECTCLADFAALWTFTKSNPLRKNKPCEENEDDSDGDSSEEELLDSFFKIKGGYIKRRTKARVIRFRNFGLTSSADDFYREQLMLYQPWRNEDNELLVENVKDRYELSRDTIDSNRVKYNQQLNISKEDLQQVEQDELAGDYYIDNEFEVLYNPDVEGDFGLEMGANSKTTRDILKMPGMTDDESYKSLMNTLNVKQQRYHNHVLSTLGIQVDPLYEFVAGGAGVGKSMLIKAITQSIIRISVKEVGKDPSRIRVLLCAPTGTV